MAYRSKKVERFCPLGNGGTKRGHKTIEATKTQVDQVLYNYLFFQKSGAGIEVTFAEDSRKIRATTILSLENWYYKTEFRNIGSNKNTKNGRLFCLKD